MISLKEIIDFSKQNGFIFSGSEIYGGLSSSFDYGPLGSLLKQNIKKAWIKKFIQESETNILLDSSILLNSKVWETSGHLNFFIDFLAENKDNNKRYRADILIKEHNPNIDINLLSLKQMTEYLVKNKILGTKNWAPIKKFNLLFKTHQGVVLEKATPLYLRPETCQGIFINFKNILKTTRKKIPFGVGQIGKSFRNEITTNNFIFRTCEFEQMELEFFCKPSEYESWFFFWQNFIYKFLLDLGFDSQKIRLRENSKNELSHYSNKTTDFLFNFPWGFDELWGIASRQDFDLKNHQKNSGQDLQYFDEVNKEKFWPFVIEPSVGVERIFLAIISNCLFNEKIKDNNYRIVLKIHPFLSPYKIAILPLIKKKHSLLAKKIMKELCPFFEVYYDENRSIGKRYRRQDALGTPFCCTIDDNSLVENTVTVRDRDTLEQEVIHIKEIHDYIDRKIFF
ncbi:glycine--tRNA ligase [Candidatus Phytoplasma sacchari]|nr:glycine--tRNA ligase [Candidatus Phytoplasma sacchari]KAB8122762.1 glycine--tRNA ligase [Candidatus Phytoplasma sacchari]